MKHPQGPDSDSARKPQIAWDGEDDYFEEPDRPSFINIATIRGFLWRQRIILVGITLAALLAGFVVTLLTQPLYTATATVRVDPEAGQVIDGEKVLDVRGPDILRYIATLSAVVQSRSMAYQVVDKLKLASDPRFGGEKDEVRNQTVRRNNAANAVKSGLTVKVPDLDRVISLSYLSPDPTLAAKIVNGYAETFVMDDTRRSIEKNSYAQKYLADEIDRTRIAMQDAERKAISFARANSIVGPGMIGNTDGDSESSAPQTVTGTNLLNMNASFTAARAKRISAEQRWRAVAGSSPLNLPEVQASQVYQTLVGEKAKKTAELANARQRYGEAYPEVLELQANIKALDGQISKTVGEIREGLRQTFVTARSEEAAFERELGKVSADTLNEQDRRVVLNQLERNAASLGSQLKVLLDRYNQLTSTANVQPGTMTILDLATVPTSPSSPNLPKNLLFALILGLGLAGSLALLREVLDDRLRSIADVEDKLGLRPLGVTPLVEGKNVNLDDFTPLGESYSSIRSAIEFNLPHADHNVLMLTSSQSGEGKSTTAVALARKYASIGRKVLLIDADLRRPSISHHFGQGRGKNGFVEVILGQASMSATLINSGVDGLDVLPVGAVPANPVDVLSSSLIADFISKTRDQYSLILLDAPPVMGIADAPLLAHLVDGVIFVVEANRAHNGQAKTAIRRLRAANRNIIGAVLTKFRALEAGHSYAYQYDYYSYRASSENEA